MCVYIRLLRAPSKTHGDLRFKVRSASELDVNMHVHMYTYITLRKRKGGNKKIFTL